MITGVTSLVIPDRGLTFFVETTLVYMPQTIDVKELVPPGPPGISFALRSPRTILEGD
jgi:hypothetical protein